MNKILTGVISVTALLLILLLVNAISSNLFSAFFVDFSEEKLYTLSEGSEAVISKLDESVTLKYFFSKTDSADFPALKLYSDRVLGLLKQFQRASEGKLNLEVFDPRPDSEDADWAEKFGLWPIALPGGSRVFFGLAGVSESGEEKSIASFDINNQESLEYDISKLIYSLSQPDKAKVSILSSLDLGGSQQPANQPGMSPVKGQPWFFVEQLKEFFDTKIIDQSSGLIPSDTDVLMLVHPKNLSEKLLFEIDQYVLRGGSLIVMVDPYCQADPPPSDASNPAAAAAYQNNSNLKPLLEAWGLELGDGGVVADKNLSTKIQVSRESPPEDFLLWLSLGEQNIAREDVVTRGLEKIVLPWSGELLVSELEGVQVTPIFHSSDKANLVKPEELKGPTGTPSQILQRYSYGGEKRILAARLKGILQSAFKKGAPEKTKNDSGQSIEHLKQSSSESNILVFADVDFISDNYSVSVQNSFMGGKVAVKLNDNLPLVLNAVENMAGSSDLIGIRSRGKVSRGFTLVEEIERNAELKWKEQERVFAAKLADAEQRLQKFQTGPGTENSPVFSAALMTELENLREEKASAQASLRKVRRNLREDVERLGTRLFLINTFAVPLALVLFSCLWIVYQSRKSLS